METKEDFDFRPKISYGYELEDAVILAYNGVDDLDYVIQAIVEGEDMGTIRYMLIGQKMLQDRKLKKIHDLVEEGIRTGKINMD